MEAVRLAEVGIRLVPVNRRLHGVAEVVSVRVPINMRVRERAIVAVQERRVTVNIQAVTVQRIMSGAVVLVYVTVVSNTVVAEQDIHPEVVRPVEANTRVVTAQVGILGMEAVAC